MNGKHKSISAHVECPSFCSLLIIAYSLCIHGFQRVSLFFTSISHCPIYFVKAKLKYVMKFTKNIVIPRNSSLDHPAASFSHHIKHHEMG